MAGLPGGEVLGRTSGAAGPRGIHLLGDRPDDERYRLLPIAAGRWPFLAALQHAFDVPILDVWTEAGRTGATFDRACNDGLVTAIVRCDGREVAVAWSDFRMHGASYGEANSQRFTAFLRQLRRSDAPIPLVYVVNSAGLRIMEGRTSFSSAFGIWPELLRYADERLVLTCAVGKCLGLAPLLYGLGHYRVGVGGQTQINLTGPDVLRLFFGKGCDFDRQASVERCMEQHDLVHEIVPSTEDALRLFRRLISSPASAATHAIPSPGPRTGALLDRFLDGPPREIVPGWCPRVRLFIGARRGRPLGVFVNPLERSNNLVTVRTLEKYAAGLDLFRALRLPIVSILDSPGIDPRVEQGDANNMRRILDVGEKIIRYPWGAMGVVAGRCFGGASTLGFPKVFGGSRAVALRGAQIGVMDDRIIAEILSASARLLAQWQETVNARGADLADLIANGTLDAVVEPSGLAGQVDRFLLEASSRAGTRPQLLEVVG